MLNEQQIKYLNAVSLQHLMQLDPQYSEARKREIYKKTISNLSIHMVEEYWRVNNPLEDHH
jgi:hypothetical protein